MRKYLIILDIDNTLLDHSYRSTSPTINSVIEQMQNEGHVFVINSNRSLDDILPIVKMFDINGKIIGENGCFIYDINKAEEKRLVDDDILLQLNEIKRILPQIITQHFPDSYYSVEDTTAMNKNPDSIKVNDNFKNIFIENCFRHYSLSVHVREISKGFLSENMKALHKIVDLLNSYVKRQSLEVVVNYSEAFCNLLVYPKNCDKGKAFDSLVEAYTDYKKIIIADDIDDKPLLGQIDKFCVVNNASSEVKEMADYVSPERVTKGVEEILLNLDKIT